MLSPATACQPQVCTTCLSDTATSCALYAIPKLAGMTLQGHDCRDMTCAVFSPSPQAFFGSDTNERNSGLPNNGAITPCGLIGWSQFNDTFALQRSAGSGIKVGFLGIGGVNERATWRLPRVPWPLFLPCLHLGVHCTAVEC